jgi:tetratricopeptide (TPR) repeat protein
LEIYRAAKDPAALLKVLGQGVAKGGSLEPFGSQLEELLKNTALVEAILSSARQMKDEPGEDASSYRAAALLAIQAKKLDAVGEFYELAVDGSKSDELAQVLLVWGVELLRAEKYPEAAAVFQRGIQDKVLSDNNPAFHFYLAGSLELGGKTDEALAAARQAIEKQPKSAQFQSRIGWILYHAKRYDEAIAAYKDLLSKFDKEHSSPEAREAMRDARLILSNLYVLKNDNAQAEEWLQQVLDEFPDDVGASNDLGYLWADGDKHLRLALKMIRRAVKAEPDNKAYRDSFGWALYRLGHYQEAKVELEAATAGGDSDGVILEHLAEVQWKLGETALALSTFKKAKEAMESDNEPDLDRVAKLNARIEELERSLAAQTREHADK